MCVSIMAGVMYLGNIYNSLAILSSTILVCVNVCMCVPINK